jgi:hypothetical protein
VEKQQKKAPEGMSLRKLPKILLACILITGIITSCSMRREKNSPYAVYYQSHSNGLANIQLKLQPDQQFRFDLTLLPEAGTGDTLAERFIFTGQWSHDAQQYFVRFKRSEDIDLFALVNPEYEPTTNVEVVDYRTLAFPLDAQEIVIWGILCYRAPM